MFKFNSPKDIVLEEGNEYITRLGHRVTGLSFTHVHDGFNVYTGFVVRSEGRSAHIWRGDGRTLTEYYYPSNWLNSDIVALA